MEQALNMSLAALNVDKFALYGYRAGEVPRKGHARSEAIVDNCAA
jgi:hypothetical protein